MKDSRDHGAIGFGLVVLLAFSGCKGPMENPVLPESLVTAVESEPEVEAPPAEEPAVAPVEDPFPGENSPDLPPVWMLPITFDPTSGWAQGSSSSTLLAPPWGTRAFRGEGATPTALSRGEKEQLAAAVVLQAGLFTAALLGAFR